MRAQFSNTVRSAVLAGVSLGVLAAGCGGDDAAPRTEPVAVVTPGVQADGTYQVGTLADPEAEAALRSAVETLPLAVSYDHRTLDDSLTRATAAMTPTFAEEFREIFERTTRARALREQAITSALVRGAGVVDPVVQGRVTCLIYMDQILVASKLREADSPLKVTQTSVRVRMQKVDDVWKVDGIEPF